MVWLFLIVAFGAGLFALPGGGRSVTDRRLAQFVSMTAFSAALLTLKLLPLGLLLMVIASSLMGLGWLKDKLTLGGGFQDLDDESSGRAAPPPSSEVGMSKAEALSVLGLAFGANPDEIQDAHRRMIARAHPDSGGSDYLAAKINEARDVLLR